MFKYDIRFLEEKLGEFDKEYQYPRTSLIEGSLLYVERNTKEELDDEINQIKQDEFLSPTYIWGYVSKKNAIYFTRTFGENKVFIYNPDAMKKTEYVKGKLKVLKNLQHDTVDDLFDQKAVFDYFYKKLWDLRLDLGREIRDKNGIPDNIALMEAQHIIDRIIFTYFICEKELISVKDYGYVKGKELFSDIIGQLPDTWNYLKKLFFEQFAKENAKDLDCGGDVFIKTPYLNGGLFRPKIIAGISEKKLNIEYAWNNIFEPLNKYSWIIEDEIADLEGEYEGNLTPEIIGHIYEKFVISIGVLDEVNLDELNISKTGDLKKGNKKIGAYYTREEVTDYMARNTIVPYVLESLEIEDNIDFNKFVNDSDVETRKNVLDSLQKIKVCDPACGSGAFIIKAGEILLEYNEILLKKLGTSQIDRYSLKKNIIINNLYGVDIQENAVEICKLRLWLWLISSAVNQKAEPLPNIEYNFVVGNSLIGWTHEKLTQSILINVDESFIMPLKTLKIGYETEQREIIDNAINLLKKTDIKDYAEAIGLLKGLYSYSEGENAEILKETIVWTKKAIYNKINGVYHDYLSSKGCKISFDQFADLDPLHWRVEFIDIFDNGGFDVIIENPPYISFGLRGVGKLPSYLKDFYKKQYNNSAEYKISIYAIFFNRTIDLLKNDGYCSLITPDSFLLGMYFSKIRRYILDKTMIKELLFAPFPIFVGVTVGTSVISTLKKKPTTNINENFLKSKLSKTFEDFTQSKFETYSYSQNYFETLVYNRFRLFFNKLDYEIVLEIEKESFELGYFIKFSSGLIGKKGKMDIISKKKESNMWKPGLISGDSVKRYSIDNPSNYILFDFDKLKSGFKDAIYDVPKLFVRQTGDRITGSIDSNKLLCLNNLHVGNIINKEYNLLSIITILNSNLITWYYRKISLEEGRTMAQTDIESLEKLPIRYNESIWKCLEFLCKCLLILKEGPIFEYIDKDIVDTLIYELYLGHQLEKEGVDSNFNKNLKDYIFDIDKIKSEKDKLKALRKFSDDIISDSVIQNQIQTIKGHPWIQKFY